MNAKALMTVCDDRSSRVTLGDVMREPLSSHSRFTANVCDGGTDLEIFSRTMDDDGYWRGVQFQGTILMGSARNAVGKTRVRAQTALKEVMESPFSGEAIQEVKHVDPREEIADVAVRLSEQFDPATPRS